MPREQLKTAEALEAPQTIEEKVDRHGDISAEIEKLEAQIENARVKDLREQIAVKSKAQAALREDILKEATAHLGDKSATEVHGARFFAKIGKCAMKRTITDMKKAAELVGLDNFFELCSFPLMKVDDYLNPKERALVIEETHDGARSFKVKTR
jgi:hypothetical protein